MVQPPPHDSEGWFVTVPGHPGLRACSDGHIYRLDGSRMPEHRKEAGENRFRISCSTHGTYHDVGRLIAMAFWGDQSGGATIHRNGNPADNRPQNLRWVQNAGTNSGSARRRRLNRFECREVHIRLNRGEPKTRIAADLEISPRCVRYHHNSCRCDFTTVSTRLL